MFRAKFGYQCSECNEEITGNTVKFIKKEDAFGQPKAMAICKACETKICLENHFGVAKK